MTWEWVALLTVMMLSCLAVWWKLQERLPAGRNIQQMGVDLIALKSEAAEQMKLNEEFRKFMSLHKMSSIRGGG